MNRRSVVQLIVCLTIGSGISRADIIYDTFLPGDIYQCCAGIVVTGASAMEAGIPLGQNEAAGAFTPLNNYLFTQIDVAFFFGYATNTNGYTLSLNEDSSGTPGAPIETWTGLFAPAQGSGVSSVVETVMPVDTVLLTAGQQYWVVAYPAASDTFDVWSVNASNGSGVGDMEAQNSGSGWQVYSLATDGIAFDVQGTAITPEPGTLLLIPFGVMGLGWMRKFRRRA